MDLEIYKARRAQYVAPAWRVTCVNCRKAAVTCYCHVLRPFSAPADFVILQHPMESRNSIATARMAHLSIKNSELFVGVDFSDDEQVNAMIHDPGRRSAVLYPSPHAISLEEFLAEEDDRPPCFWVMDGKWSHIPQMLRLSPNVRTMRQVKFRPERESRFEIRKQPNPMCMSTIESIHLVIDLMMRDRDPGHAEHHTLLDVFQYLVNQQKSFVNTQCDTRHKLARMARAARRLERELAAPRGDDDAEHI